MIYNLRDETYDDDELELMEDKDIELLRADVKAERTHLQAFIKRKQHEFKSGAGPGLPTAEHALKEMDVSALISFESQLEYIQAERASRK